MPFRTLLVATLLLVPASVNHPAASTSPTPAIYTAALHRALLHTNATALLLDVTSGRVLATQFAARAAAQPAAPGSVLKPFYLQTALEANIIQPTAAIHCSRTLHIAGHTLNCGHPTDPPALTARQALAYSCNSYFAALAAHLTAQQITSTLHRYALDQTPHLFPNEAAAPILTPQTVEERQLFLLGVTGIRITPAQLAAAYRRLALAHLNHTDSPSTAVLWQGLEDSVLYGTSDSAAVPGLITAGKTGTADNPNSARPHGWFVGIAPATSPRIIIVIFVPIGTGADASLLAHNFYLAAANALRGVPAQ